MQISTLFVLCALVVAACAQSAFIIDLPVGGTDVDVGIQSDWFFIRAPVTPNTTVTVSISEGTDNTDLSATSLTFTPTIQQLSFRFTTKVTGFITFDLSLDNTDQFVIASTFTVYSQPRALQLDQSFPTSFYLDLVTEPIKLYITEPHTSALTLTPTITTYPAGNAVPVSISPSTITIAAGDLSASFVITASTTQFAGLVQLSWGTIGGDSNNWFTTSLIDSTGFALSTNLRTSIVAPSFSSSFITGPASNTLYFYTSGDRPNDTLTITPQAADTTFSPSSISLDANTQVAQFTVTTTSTETNKPVYFYTSNTASNYFTKIAAGTLNSPKLNFWIDSPSTFAVTKPSKISIKIEYPATNDVSVTLYAANLIFNPATVAFSGATTGIDVTVTPVNTGSDTISFKVTGTDANWYNVPEDYSVGIEKGSITGPASWYVPSLFVGQESDPLPLRLNFAPATDIVVTPMAPDVIFTPANLTFTPNTVEQFFTITPVLAGTAVSRNVPISFAVSGTDWAWFTAPASTSVTVSQRILQTAWTSDIELGETTTVYVGRDYTVWVSTNFVGSSDSFTVTPVSNYFTFNPQILTFNSGTLRATYTATPIAGVRSATSASITYIVSGQAAGYYNSLPTDSLSISIRPLYFYSATVSRDDRLPAALTRYVNASNYGALSTASYYIGQALTSNHVHSFSIATPAFPKSKVTITPKSAHISFSPSSVTLTSSSSTTIWAPATVTLPGAASYLQNGWEPTYLAIANFTVSGSAAGSHDVWFELSSDDADYYAPPPHTFVTIRKYTGGGSSASSTVVASIGMVVASIVLALFL